MAKKTASKSGLYSYRNGKKVYLTKEPDKIVVRAKPEELAKRGMDENTEKVSSNSTRVTVSSKRRDAIMKELRKDTVTHHAYTQKDNNAEFLITDRIFVTFKQPASNEQLTQFMTKYALVLKNQYSEKEYLFQLTDQTGMNPVKLVVAINEKEKKIVESCEHDLNKRMTISINIPSDAKYTQQWHLHTRLTHSAVDARSSSNCEGAWNLLNHFGSQDVVVAVSDDGCKLDHPDFDSPNKFAHWGYMQGTSLINRDSVSADPKKMYQDGADHGTCCCGVVAAEIDGVLTVGAAPGCKLLPIKWESSGPSLLISDSKMLTVLTFIADKADVLSNSWGSSPEFLFAINVINKITQLSQTGGRRGKGILFLWAAGNENCPIQYSGPLNIPYDNGYNQFGAWQGVETSNVFEHNLATVPGVMHVAALASNAQRSHYSNYGNGISICAPSSNSHEYWRMAVTGLGILTTSGRSPFFDSEFGGTSSATPLVAGIAGLVISANSGLTALQVVSILQRTAGKDLNMTAYPRTPAAAYDPNTSWDISPVAPHNTGTFKSIGHPDGTWSGWFGFGKVDAAAAVAEALRVGGGVVGGGNTIVQSSTPAKQIPDNSAVGVTDAIAVIGAGTIASVKVEVGITHTYVGDLVVRIISPRGTSVDLHNRNGGNTDNLNKVFDIQNTAGLSILNGEPVSGTWTLFVADQAPADTGILNKWTLHLGTAQTQAITVEESPGVMIPDNNSAGIERSLNVSANASVKEIEVGMDITHSYISDLIVNLVAPSGNVTSLHNRAGGTADNIIKTYDFNNNVSLRALIGQQAQGTWKLKVSDVVGQDVGKLNKWSIKIIKQ